MKNNLSVDLEECLVCYLSQTFAGRMHDKRMYDEAGYVFPPGCVLLKDTGCQGFEPENVLTYQPKKKPRNHALSTAEKAENRMISRLRILIEHALAGVKRCRIVHDVLRKTKARFDDLVMESAWGLHNFRATLRYNMLE